MAGKARGWTSVRSGPTTHSRRGARIGVPRSGAGPSRAAESAGRSSAHRKVRCVADDELGQNMAREALAGGCTAGAENIEHAHSSPNSFKMSRSRQCPTDRPPWTSKRLVGACGETPPPPISRWSPLTRTTADL